MRLASALSTDASIMITEFLDVSYVMLILLCMLCFIHVFASPWTRLVSDRFVIVFHLVLGQIPAPQAVGEQWMVSPLNQDAQI